MKDLSFLTDKVFAHRGVHSNCPENSTAAFKKAVEKGYPIELDVQLTKDNEVIVFHDATLKRMCNIPKKPNAYDLKELKNICLNESKESIPTLKEVLKIINGKVPVIVELKSASNNSILETETMKLLDNYKGIYAIQSFDPYILKWFRKNRPNIVRGLLVTDNKKSNAFYRFIALRIAKPDYLGCSKYLAKKRFIKRFNKKGVVLAWTMKNQEDLVKYKEYFDNFICDYL